MAEPLKTFFSVALVRRIATEIAKVDRSFPSRAFIKSASAGLEELELLDRGRHISRALGVHLPRDYLAAIPERAFAFFRKWAKDKNAHVRRLVSEGTRLRLPWASRVAWLDANPERVLELLEQLKDDPTTLVRRSVANNLNDLGKLHPVLLTRTCALWLGGGAVERRALVEQALRSAVKRGEPQALRLLGYGKKPAVSIDGVRFEPRRVAIGGQVTMSFVLRSESRVAQDLLVDVAVHFVKANGRATPKVFKLKRVALPARAQLKMQTRVSLAVHTTRKPCPGAHVVDILVNGEAKRAGAFQVSAGSEPVRNRS